MNEIQINNTSLAVKEYNGQRVVTLRDVDKVHNRPDGTARKRFNDNKERFVVGEDYFKITPSEFRTAIGDMDKRQQNDIILLTESGYLMLVKSFTDDLAWTVQRQLVKSYFRAKEQTPDYSALSPQLQFMIQMEQRQNKLETAVENTNRRISEMCETMTVRGDNWRKKTHALINHIASATGTEPKEIYLDIYDELEYRAGCNLSVRLDNLRDRFYERGFSQSKLDRLNNIDAIAADKRLTEIYISIVREMAVKSSVLGN